MLSVFSCVLFTEAVRLNPLTSKASDNEVEGQTKDWLKFATERHVGRKDRDMGKRIRNRLIDMAAKHGEKSTNEMISDTEGTDTDNAVHADSFTGLAVHSSDAVHAEMA